MSSTRLDLGLNKNACDNSNDLRKPCVCFYPVVTGKLGFVKFANKEGWSVACFFWDHRETFVCARSLLPAEKVPVAVRTPVK